MSDLPTRPQAPAPNIDTIPAELIARPQWVIWSYELKNDKWTKVPYTPGTTSKASHSRPSSWRGFAEAVASYQARPDFFAGIGYVFSKDDPYVGGDIDHSLDLGRVPNTYAEISPSGNGIKFIARASGDYGRKTARGELYSRRRFFTITGNVLAGHESIADCQDGVDAFAATLGNAPRTDRTLTEGTAGGGGRAALVASHPESEWEEARHLTRTSMPFQERCLINSAKEGTQLAYLLAGDYAGFHARWPVAGIYRQDGTLDDSQVRAVMARSIYGRGFTFPRYVTLMSHYFAAQALAKWGTKQAWREELAALWQYAAEHTGYTPRHAAPARTTAKRPRGRANIHTATTEQVYDLLLENRAGTDAIIHIADIAAAIGVHRRTVTSILDELRAAERITTRRLAGGGGLLVTFLPKRDVIIGAEECAAPSVTTPEIAPDAAPHEETRESCVSSEARESDHISESPSLATLAAYYLDQPAPTIGQRRVSTKTGQITYRRTAQHFAQLASAEYGYPVDLAIETYRAEQMHRKELEAQAWQRFFAKLKHMTDAELIQYIGGRLRSEVAELAREGSDFDMHLFRVRLKCARLHLTWRGLEMPKRATKLTPVAPRQPRASAPVVEAEEIEQVSLFSSLPQGDVPHVGTLSSLLAGIQAYHAAVQ